jgi:1,4-alpha-glucan branching enzyme
VIRRQRDGKSGNVKVTFTLPQDHPPGQVSVVGSFNDWTPGQHRMVNRAGGVRSVSITAPPGMTLRFRYLGENGHWFDDPEADRVDGQGSQIEV